MLLLLLLLLFFLLEINENNCFYMNFLPKTMVDDIRRLLTAELIFSKCAGASPCFFVQHTLKVKDLNK